VGIYTDSRLLGNFVVSLPTYDRNFTQSLTMIVLAKTAPGVSQDQAKAAVSKVAREFPNVKIEDQASSGRARPTRSTRSSG
jgi:hypothetical protein